MKDQHHDDKSKTKFYSLCKVGTGYSLSQLEELRAKLMPCAIKKIDNVKGYAPPWMQRFQFKSGEAPDVWVSLNPPYPWIVN